MRRAFLVLVIVSLVACGDGGSVLDAPESIGSLPPSTANSVSPATTPGASPSLVATTDTAATAPEIPGYAWSGPEAFEFVPASPSVARAVVSTGPDLVAVGSTDVAGVSHVAVWVSGDAVTWERVADDPAFAGEVGGGWAHDVAAFADGVIAVGAADDGFGNDFAVWSSAGSRSWVRQDLDAAYEGNQTGDAVVRTPDGWVAVGWSDGPTLEGLDATWWVANEPEDWGMRFRPDSGDEAMLDVALVEGTLIAVGFAQQDADGTFGVTGPQNGAVWISENDGEVFSRVEAASLDDDETERIDAVVPFGAAAVLVGGTVGPHGDVDAAVWLWTAEDGVQEVDESAFAIEGTEWLETITMIGDDLVAIGRRLAGDGVFDVIAWTSSDGLVWHPVGPPTQATVDQRVVGAVGAADRLTVVGAANGAAAFWGAIPGNDGDPPPSAGAETAEVDTAEVLWSEPTYDQLTVLEHFGWPHSFFVAYGPDPEVEDLSLPGPMPIHRLESWDYLDWGVRFNFRNGLTAGYEYIDVTPGVPVRPGFTPLDFDLGMGPSEVEVLLGVPATGASTFSDEVAPGLRVDSYHGQVFVTFDSDSLVGVHTPWMFEDTGEGDE